MDKVTRSNTDSFSLLSSITPSMLHRRYMVLAYDNVVKGNNSNFSSERYAIWRKAPRQEQDQYEQ